MFWIIAWRSILAKKLRSLSTIILSVFCTVFLIFSLAFMNGQHEKMIRDSVEIYTGYIQITGKDYKNHPDYDHLIFDLSKTEKAVDKFPEIKHAGERFETFALFAVEENSVGGLLVGVNPGKEQYLSRISPAVVSGSYLEDNDKAVCIMGEKLAKRLNVKIGDNLTYLSEAVDLSQAADILKIKGIFITGSQIDSECVFINKKYMDGMFLTGNIASHYIIRPENDFLRGRLDNLTARLNKNLTGTGTEALTWKTPLKSILQLVTVDAIFGYFSFGIIVIIVFFVIMIFSLISIFQRTKEIGILRAVGTKPSQILLMVIGEAVILGMIAVITGGLIGGALTHYYSLNPIKIAVSKDLLAQYQAFGIVDMTFPTMFSALSVIRICLFMLMLNILAVIYPAMKVNKYRSIEAINYV